MYLRNALPTICIFVITLITYHVAMAFSGQKRVNVGVYYFPGWQSGQNFHLDEPNSLLKTPAFVNRKPLTGWYDDKQKVVNQEIVWAVRGGVNYFAFLWYWPAALNAEESREPLPLEYFLKSSIKERRKIDFCIVYTNHDRFDISPGAEWDRYTTMWTESMMRKDYVKLRAGLGEVAKPLLIIWSADRFHEHWDSIPGGAKAALDSLRAKALKRGLPGINIAACWGPSSSKVIMKDGYDMVTGYNFHTAENSKFGQPSIYDSLINQHVAIWDSVSSLGKAVIPFITSGWDPRPWPDEFKHSPYYPDRSPKKFERFCRLAKDWVNRHEEDTPFPKTILIYAWNELGEGGYILPTVGDGYAYLNVIRKVFQDTIFPLKGTQRIVNPKDSFLKGR